MDIKDIQSAKQQLQDQISTLLTQFGKDTGLAVDGINIDNVFRMGSLTSYVIRIEVKL